jgi:3,5-epimerase/4-reductase
MKKILTIALIFSLIVPKLSHADTFLLFGARGWIGSQLADLIQKNGDTVIKAQSRLENRQDIEKEIEATYPDFVINTAAITGRPNSDWCEDHKQETIRANVIGALNLADICFTRNIHLTNFCTGCIYEYDNQHQPYETIGFTEQDKPNFDGSYYSKTKSMVNELMADYPNVLHLRLRICISDDLHERSFITKIITYKKIINMPNSLTVLHDLLPLSLIMAKRHLAGIYNFVNPGTITHNEVLEMYKQYIDPTFTYENFSVAEQNRLLKSRRANNTLDVSKLLQEFPGIPDIKISVQRLFEQMRTSLKR